FFIGHAVQLYQVGFVSQVDDIIYDARLRMTMPAAVDRRIVILDIDEKSLGEIGRWPWPRSLMAEVVTKLFDQHGVAVLGFDVAYYEPLALAMVRTVIALQTGQAPDIEPGYFPGQNRLEWLKVGNLVIPVDESASALVPYRAWAKGFQYVSLADVLKDRIKPGELKGRIALVGTTAPGLEDLRATPVNPSFPGVEIHANLIAGMLDGE